MAGLGYMGWAVGLVIVTGYIIRLITAVGYMVSDYGRSISQCSEKSVGKEDQICSSLLHLPYARNKACISDTVQPLQTMILWKTLCKDTWLCLSCL